VSVVWLIHPFIRHEALYRQRQLLRKVVDLRGDEVCEFGGYWHCCIFEND